MDRQTEGHHREVLVVNQRLSSYLLQGQNGSYGSAVQRLVLLQPPLSAERGRAATVSAGEEPQPGGADTWASVHAVHRPATSKSLDRYLLIGGRRSCLSVLWTRGGS